ncbi:uncharacterized protein PFL1_01873 [Pseudozyma flocculosa PF-1]|uniref:Nuclear transport factor 2 n=1 Tax=Pseudozyma flocculosa TaxID=84751 RepID=A0A5C3F0I2_9BASI|nr:uncharacterized protein PFL1_01873 [Pseudozyma flocculosa PF-1]EPQ30347.1 hypothetical protein PFL1_01873 [Pseudozyma flocculosa PF-1]SPO37416.1 probable NTF2 - nuclear transport factor [Pseudozyma flocculosa]
MADINAVAQQFTQYYYSTFDTSRGNLGNLYRDHSMLTFEGSQVMGAQAIVEKLQNLPFQKVKHEVGSLDAQPTGTGGSLLVLVTGALLVDEEANPLKFSQAFTLNADNGSFYVYNDVFRLVFG